MIPLACPANPFCVTSHLKRNLKKLFIALCQSSLPVFTTAQLRKQLRARMTGKPGESSRHLLPFLLCCAQSSDSLFATAGCGRWRDRRCQRTLFFHAAPGALTRGWQPADPSQHCLVAAFHLRRPLKAIDSDPLSKPGVFEEFDAPLRSR